MEYKGTKNMKCKYFVFAKVEEMTKVYLKDKRKISSSSMKHQLKLVTVCQNTAVKPL